MANYGFNEVLPGLFVGSRFAVHQRYLKNFKITHLLSLDNFKDFPPGYICKTIDVDDEESENIMKYFEECLEFIHNNQVLVFCTAGRSRSATVVAAYLIKYKGMNVEKALNTINKVRKVRPNPGFLVQLQEWEEKNCELCELEKKTEWIEENPDFVCMLCEQCDLPMVVYRKHSNFASNEVKNKMAESLSKAADKYIGKSWVIDRKQRSVFYHLHWHARPALFKL